MANSHFLPALGNKYASVVTLDGYVGIAADASIDADLSATPFVTVTHPTTGEYLLTFDQEFNSVLHPNVIFHSTVGAALFPQVQAMTTGSVLLRLVNGSGSATDPSAICGLSYSVRVSNSSAVKPTGNYGGSGNE